MYRLTSVDCELTPEPKYLVSTTEQTSNPRAVRNVRLKQKLNSYCVYLPRGCGRT